MRQGSLWQSGPEYLLRPREEWPFSREFIDMLPTQELRAPKAWFNLSLFETSTSAATTKFTRMMEEIMWKSNSWDKTTHVTARILKAMFSVDRGRIMEN